MKIFKNLILVVFALQAYYFLCNAELEVEGEEKPASYVGYQLLRVYPNTVDDVRFLQSLEDTPFSDFDVWCIHRENGILDVSISPKSLLNYKSLLRERNIKFIILEENLQNKIDEQSRLMASRSKAEAKSILFKYARYSEIINFIDSTVASNNDIATSYVAGLTVENRQLKVIRLKAPDATTDKAVWIDCGIHAREWVTPATCVYIIDQLVKEYRANENGNLLSKYEVHVLPLHNADGYEYSHTSYRLWRKNKQPNKNPSTGQPLPPGTCVGTDLNRNYPFGWRTGGSSTDPCSDTYSGPTAGSELETKAVMGAINAKAGSWVAFFNVHSFGNWWLTPWGNSTTVRPDNYNDMVAKANIGAAALKAYKGQNQVFKVGTSASLLYINSGSAKDWARGDLNIPYAYVLELRPSQTDPTDPDGTYGFLLPEDRMVKVAPETFAGIKACVNAM